MSASPLQVSAPDRILDAAEQLVTELGAARLTLDQVAHRAGVSKGGLLYHFPSKESLLAALADRYVNELSQRRDAARNELPDEPARELKSCVHAMLCHDQPRSQAVVAALLGIAAHEPALLAGIRQQLAEHTARLAASEGCFARQAVVSLAVDGLSLRECLRMSPFTSEQRDRVIAELMLLAEEAYRQ